ncbi:unnamed protein product [Somion occarium]|uniref:PIN domain-containing protein n=1 Tax=Somion occarium TaxID=3059160 RepID=A0ABP1D282_9APHY
MSVTNFNPQNQYSSWGAGSWNEWPQYSASVQQQPLARNAGYSNIPPEPNTEGNHANATTSRAFRRDNTLDRISQFANEDVEMTDVVASDVNRYLIVDTNFLIDHLAVLKRFSQDLEELASNVRFAHLVSGLQIIVPSVVLSELDGLKKREELRWFAQTASTWLLEKSKERGLVKVQSRKETLPSSTLSVGEVDHRKNDLAIFDCCQFFATKGRVCLVSADKNLSIECEANGIFTIKPPQGRWTSRALAYAIYGEGIPGSCFHGTESGPGYKYGPSAAQPGRSQPPTVLDEEPMDIDEDLSDNARPEDFEPSHALDALHIQIIEHFTLVLKEVAERVRRANGDLLPPTDSHHAPSYRRKPFHLWRVGDCLEYLDSKKRLRARSPSLRVFLLRRNEDRGWRRGQDWSRQDWVIAMQSLEEIGQLFDEGLVLDSLESLSPHVDWIFKQPMRPTG